MHNYQVKLFIPMLKGAYLAIIHFSQIVKRKKSSYSQRISAGLKVKKCNVKNAVSECIRVVTFSRRGPLWVFKYNWCFVFRKLISLPT